MAELLDIARIYLLDALVFGISAAALVLFILSLKNYKKRDKNDEKQCRTRKRTLIVSASLLAAVAIAWTVIIILLLSELREISLRQLNLRNY